MNSERRHELQENELASALDKINKKIDPYSKPIAAVVALGFIGLLGWGFYSSTRAEQRSDATYQLMMGSISGDSETLAQIAETYPKTPMAAWSRLYQGSQKMGAGIDALFTNRGEAEELLAEASSAYDEALSLSGDQLIQSRAHFGLARIAESLGKTDDAIAAYEAAMAAGESEPMITEARQRIELLSKPETKEFLIWFGEQDFSPADPSLPPSLPSEQMLPDLPDLNLPEFGAATETSEEPAESTEPEAATEEPAAEQVMTEQPAAQAVVNEQPVVTETPAAETPEMKAEAESAVKESAAVESAADEKPAEESAVEEKTADEKPADEKPAVESIPEPSQGGDNDSLDLSGPSNS